ncbi:MAG: ABC transporter permease [Anaerolineae bacterium]|nr:ABC transporter permease [Anaerolineae bacterium]
MTKRVVKRFMRHRMAVFGSFLLLAIVVYVIGGAFFYSEAYANDASLRKRFEAPSAEHPLGTDEAGRDVLARTIYGGQISLAIGVLSMMITVALGTIVGLVAGFYGGWIDAILMRFVEALLTIPTLILLLMLSRVLIDLSSSTIFVLGREISITVVVIVLIVGLLSWMSLARIVRSMVLSLKEQEFVIAATTLGANKVRIIFQHILPNCIAPILVTATLTIGGAIVTETALSFLGFGVMPPTATWGNILNRARQDIEAYWWLWMAPGALITLTVLAINFIGDGLRDAFDPRSRK